MSAKTYDDHLGRLCGGFRDMVPFQALQMVGHRSRQFARISARATRSGPPFTDFEATKLTRKPGTISLNATFAEVIRRISMHSSSPRGCSGILAPEREGYPLHSPLRGYGQTELSRFAMGCRFFLRLVFCRGEMCRLLRMRPRNDTGRGELQNIAVDDAYVDGNLVTAAAWPAIVRLAPPAFWKCSEPDFLLTLNKINGQSFVSRLCSQLVQIVLVSKLYGRIRDCGRSFSGLARRPRAKAGSAIHRRGYRFRPRYPWPARRQCGSGQGRVV